MAKRIFVTKANNVMSFYLKVNNMTVFLFCQPFSKGVYDYFMKGRSEAEVRAFKKWNQNPRLDKTISKIPMYIRYALKEGA